MNLVAPGTGMGVSDTDTMEERMAGKRAMFVVIALFAVRAIAGQPGKASKETFSWKGSERTYFIYRPSGASSLSEKLPLILALHGSGQNGESLVSKWKDLGETEKIVIVGPDAADRARWTSPADGPLFLHDLVEEVGKHCPVDGRRVYLFGHSAGAIFALQMAALESQYFAAAAVHAGAVPAAFADIFDHAARKIPYLLLIGTRDAFFPLEAVRATRDALTSRGFTVEYVEMSGHTHDYSSAAEEINRRVWTFFSKHSLTVDPQYRSYRGPD